MEAVGSGVTALAPIPQAEPPIRITDAQLDWLSFRMTSATDEVACAKAGVTPEDLAEWRANDADFGRALQLAAEGDVRDVFRQLSAGLLPHALRVLKNLLSSDSPRSQKDGLTLLLKSQGLLVDREPTVARETLDELVTRLREPRPAQVLDVTPRE